MDSDDIDEEIEAATNEVPVQFNSLEEMFADLNDDSDSSSLEPLFKPVPLTGEPADALRQMRSEERY